MKHSTSLLAFAVANILSAAAFAAEETSTSALEEIVVTAERRPQSLQDIPTSATVLSAESLAKGGVKNIVDLQRVAPSVAINTYNRGTFVNIRGVGIAQSAPTSVPGVATYIDGVYIPHETFIAQSFYDIGSVEVLRGPQGTLTGQNSTGGAIYMRTPAVDMEKFSGYAEQTAANYSWYRTVAAVNIPMGGIVGARVAATYNKSDSFTTNIGSPSQPGSNKLQAARADVRIQPIDTLSFDLRYEHFDLESGYNAIKNRYDVVTSDPFTIEENAISFLNQNGYRASVEGKWDITSGMQLRAITSRLKADNSDQADGDRRTTPTSTTAPPNSTGNARVGLTNQTFDTRVHEINLLSTGDRKINWVVGAFYMTETTPVSVLRDATSNGANPITFITPAAGTSTIAQAENKSTSGFGELDVRFTEAFELDTGLRYSKDSQDYTRQAIPGPPPPGCFPCTNTAESSKTTGRFGGKYFLSHDMMMYATVSRGYKAGGVNLDPRLNVFGPETNTVGEFGVKSTVADGHLRVNGDVFYSDYQDIQVSALVTVAGSATPVPSTVNGPRAKIYGGEVEFLGQFDALAFNLGLSVLHTGTTEPRVLTNSSIAPSVDAPVFSGTQLPFSPPVTLTVGIEYAAKIGNGTLTPRLQGSYMGEQWATFFHDDLRTRVPSRALADFRLTYVPFEGLQFEAFVTNLFNKSYVAVQVQDASSAAGGYLFGPPRQFGGRVLYKF